MSFRKKLLLFIRSIGRSSFNRGIGFVTNDIGATKWFSTRSLAEVVSLRFPPDGPFKRWRDIPELEQAGQLIGDASSAWVNQGDGAEYRRILPLLPDIDGGYRDWDVVYGWRASALSAANLKNETYAVLDSGLKVCNRKSGILETLGDIEFDHRSTSCFGWWMQACMLQSSSWVSYLKLSVAADQIDRLVFSRRLLGRVDYLGSGRPRFTKEREIALRQFAQDTASFLDPAFDLFEQYVNEYCNF